jgi:hypothetical protein
MVGKSKEVLKKENTFSLESVTKQHIKIKMQAFVLLYCI